MNLKAPTLPGGLSYSGEALVSQKVRPGHRKPRREWDEWREGFQSFPEEGVKCWSHCQATGFTSNGQTPYKCNYGHVFTAAEGDS